MFLLFYVFNVSLCMFNLTKKAQPFWGLTYISYEPNKFSQNFELFVDDTSLFS